MKYLSKDPIVFGATKKYSNNYSNINWKDDEMVEIEIELDDDIKEFIEKESKKRNKSFNDTFIELLEEGKNLLEKTKENLKERKK